MHSGLNFLTLPPFTGNLLHLCIILFSPLCSAFPVQFASVILSLLVQGHSLFDNAWEKCPFLDNSLMIYFS